MPTVARLSIATVKSTRLRHPEQVELERFGVLENRRFYVAAPDGRLITGSRHGTLLRIEAAWNPSTERLSLRFPNGTAVEDDASGVERPVETSFYGRAVAGHVVQGPWSQTLSDYLQTPADLVRPAHPGDANDEAPASLFSTASAEDLAGASGSEAPRDARRFRMLIEVAGCAPYEEDTWIGQRVRTGDAVVEVVGAVPRCVITTLDPDRGVKDFDTLKALARHRGPRGKDVLFGVWANVAEPGRVRVGDPVEPVTG